VNALITAHSLRAMGEAHARLSPSQGVFLSLSHQGRRTVLPSPALSTLRDSVRHQLGGPALIHSRLLPKNAASARGSEGCELLGEQFWTPAMGLVAEWPEHHAGIQLTPATGARLPWPDFNC